MYLKSKVLSVLRALMMAEHWGRLLFLLGVSEKFVKALASGNIEISQCVCWGGHSKRAEQELSN